MRFLIFAEDAQTFLQSRAAIGRDRGAVGLVVGSFENVGHAQIGGDCAQTLGHAHRVSFAFDHARPGDQNSGAFAPNRIEFTENVLFNATVPTNSFE